MYNKDENPKMKMIHVLHCTLFLKMGGLESIIMGMAKTMDRTRFKVSLLCLSSYDEKYLSYLEGFNVSLYHIKRVGTCDYRFFIKIIKLIRRIDVDIIHAHSGCIFNSAICAFLAGRKKFVCTEHGMPLYDNGIPMNTGVKARLEDKISAQISRRIFAVSDEIKEDMINRYPDSMDKVRIVTNGVDTDSFIPKKNVIHSNRIKQRYSIPARRKVIGSVGRLVPIKNYETLIRAFAVLKLEFGVEVHLVIIGDGSERLKLEAYAEKLGVSSAVVFAGVQYNIESILQAIDVFVLPSLTEGTSISLLESQSCGIPSVVSRVGGNPCIVKDGVNGFLFEPNDSDTLAVRLRELLSDEALRKSMGKAARSLVENEYSINSMVKAYEREYSKLLT